ncbi:YicC family protein [Paenibacillus sp. P96]|uniref:YicC family protein n=1 Tax=Paenibacillus zeirhizosphaerae TaxID=2987519 RepID=A0ABT9FQ35_9BACL|nr:YicC/YloC family endoribonuclease [Paenibacillus sp. P96]MDP4096827.1 YicC family protein [Paenibacillus sp. P96]
MSLSMTGYGQAVLHHGGYKVRFEVKSVNHRYCEVMMRIPREWTRFEDGLRREVQRRVKRGRVDVFIQRERDEEQDSYVQLNESVVQTYLETAEQLASKYGLDGKIGISELLALPNVWVDRDGTVEVEDAEWEQLLLRGLGEAVAGMLDMRSREGQVLAADLNSRIERLEMLHSELAALAPTVVDDYRNRLKQRLAELQGGAILPDEHRLGMEIALFADRSNIDEELIRLRSHLGQCRNLLLSDEPAGRKLDFLIQELNREVNTIGSKANHLELVNRVVEMKAELEKIREQAANME